MKRRIIAGITALLMAAALPGCGEEYGAAPVRTFRWTAMPLTLERPVLFAQEEEPEEEPEEELHEGQRKSYLTGEWMDERIGSIRSCRHYFISFAREFDAIYAHYGHTVYAQPILDLAEVHNISGMDGSVESVAYYRDKSRKSPHNVFTTAEGLAAASEKKGYPTAYHAAYQGHYQFAAADAPQLPANGRVQEP